MRPGAVGLKLLGKEQHPAANLKAKDVNDQEFPKFSYTAKRLRRVDVAAAGRSRDDVRASLLLKWPLVIMWAVRHIPGPTTVSTALLSPITAKLLVLGCGGNSPTE